jgi:hypothetical protein
MNLARSYLHSPTCRVSSLVKCSRLDLVCPVRRIGYLPIARVRRARDCTLQATVDVELNARNTNIITRICSQCNVSFPRNSGVVDWISYAYLGSNVVA